MTPPGTTHSDPAGGPIDGQTPPASADAIRSSIHASIQAAAAALAQADATAPSTALPLLRSAQEHVTTAIDEAMAAVLVTEGGTIRTAGALAGLSENAVGPRLARTKLLAAYGSEAGRVTAAGVERARYDLEEGRHRDATDLAEQPRPLRFRARRTT
ncbi:hypothetical protein GCM10027053_10340 [Intrasporangium mesophilum]